MGKHESSFHRASISNSNGSGISTFNHSFYRSSRGKRFLAIFFIFYLVSDPRIHGFS